MTTYAQMLTRARVELEEPSAVQWTDNELYGWMDEAAREISIAARNLRGEWSVTFAAGTATGNVSSNLVIDIDDAWWKFDADDLRRPLQIMNHRDMHSRWGMYRDVRQGIPMFLTGSKTSTSGALGVAAQTLELRLYPIPQAAGVLYYQGTRVANVNAMGTAATSSHQIECEVGWEYLVLKYTVAKAFARGQDPQRAAMLMSEYLEGLKLCASFADDGNFPNAREFVPNYFGNVFSGNYGYDEWGY